MINQKSENTELLEKRAKMTVAIIFYASQEFMKHVLRKTKEAKKMKGLEELKDIDKQNIDLIYFYALISFLFHAQKYFWEKVIKNKKTALKFEQAVYDLFEKSAGLDPKPHIKDIGEYIKKQGREGEIMYLGSKICGELNKESFFLMSDINAIYCAILNHGFSESLKKAWE